MTMPGTKTLSLRRLLRKKKYLLWAGAHDALSAKLVEEAGFEGIWVSSFGVSAAQKCLPDSNILTMTEMLSASKDIRRTVKIPVVTDCDNGYGGAMNIIRLVQEFEQAGIAGISLEDSAFPKRCSLYPGGQRELISIEEMVGRVRAAKDAQASPDFFVIARTESFVAGLGLQEALKRAHAYAKAGADAILVHSRGPSSTEVEAFSKAWKERTPLVCVPTLYGRVKASRLGSKGYKVIIFANHALRASVKAMRSVLGDLRRKERIASVDGAIAKLPEIFELVGQPTLEAHAERFSPKLPKPPTAIILAAGFEQQLMPLIVDRPKALLEIHGKTILDRQIDMLRQVGVKRIAVVRGYQKHRIDQPNIVTYDNDEYAQGYILQSLFSAEPEMEGGFLFLYGDILFDEAILHKVLRSRSEMGLVVDRALPELVRQHPDHIAAHAEFVVTNHRVLSGHRFVSPRRHDRILRIGTKISPSEATGEFIGIGRFSAPGAASLQKAYHRARASVNGRPFQEALNFSRASITDLIQELIDGGERVESIDIYKGWLEVDTLADYERAWHLVKS